jgi:hypothetical protein
VPSVTIFEPLIWHSQNSAPVRLSLINRISLSTGSNDLTNSEKEMFNVIVGVSWVNAGSLYRLSKSTLYTEGKEIGQILPKKIARLLWSLQPPKHASKTERRFDFRIARNHQTKKPHERSARAVSQFCIPGLPPKPHHS